MASAITVTHQRASVTSYISYVTPPKAAIAWCSWAKTWAIDMIVCIAEKPSVAKDIARIIGATTSRDGYMEGNGYQVTWTFGHLCTLKEPHDYTPMWKSWSLSALPMIPPRFGIKLIPDKGIAKQFAVIEQLMQKADSIINCGDAGQEGELIQRWVMQKAKAQCLSLIHI